MRPIDMLAFKSLADLHDLDHLAFNTPWSARAFGIVIAAAEQRLFSLVDFQQALIERVGRFERDKDPIEDDDVYYSLWIDALSDLLQTKGIIVAKHLNNAENSIRLALLPGTDDHHHGHHDLGRAHHHTDNGSGHDWPEPIHRERGR